MTVPPSPPTCHPDHSDRWRNRMVRGREAVVKRGPGVFRRGAAWRKANRQTRTEWPDSEGVAPKMGLLVQKRGVGHGLAGGGCGLMVGHAWEYPPARVGPTPGGGRDGRVA